ncbi:hypothetical protein L3V79_02565 [Thiotrichales bacterium 19S9-12]|nr:hypothetical protein [Thiotrichales bacterium 19S9-11]MCF6811241.1 hypothetical protein [Thiotrichales bacterium 19S9-12]
MEHIKYKDRYKVASSRLKNWNYSSKGSYFITICTKERICYLGSIKNGEVLLSDIGSIAHYLWQMIPKQFSYVSLGEFIIMPNHVHGVLTINQHKSMPLQKLTDESKLGGITKIKNPMLNQSISTIIRWYKAKVSYEASKGKHCLAWQPRFHEYVVHNKEKLDVISQYIRFNPINWEKDKLFSTKGPW